MTKTLVTMERQGQQCFRPTLHPHHSTYLHHSLHKAHLLHVARSPQSSSSAAIRSRNATRSVAGTSMSAPSGHIVASYLHCDTSS